MARWPHPPGHHAETPYVTTVRRTARAKLASWHAAARQRAENWEINAKKLLEANPLGTVRAARQEQARQFALAEAIFHQAAADLLEAYRGR